LWKKRAKFFEPVVYFPIGTRLFSRRTENGPRKLYLTQFETVILKTTSKGYSFFDEDLEIAKRRVGSLPLSLQGKLPIPIV